MVNETIRALFGRSQRTISYTVIKYSYKIQVTLNSPDKNQKNIHLFVLFRATVCVAIFSTASKAFCCYFDLNLGRWNFVKRAKKMQQTNPRNGLCCKYVSFHCLYTVKIQDLETNQKGLDTKK